MFRRVTSKIDVHSGFLYLFDFYKDDKESKELRKLYSEYYVVLYFLSITACDVQYSTSTIMPVERAVGRQDSRFVSDCFVSVTY